MASESLYGAPRPKSKTNPISLSSTSIHALSNELALARMRLSSSSDAKTAPGRTRPSKSKALFAPANKGVGKRAARDDAPDNSYGGKTSAQLGGEGVSERDLERSRKKLKEKSRLYAAMKRGDFGDESGEGLIDFDRKWAEHPSDESDEEAEGDAGGDDDDDDEIIEYEDEFGRTRKGKKSVVEREKRHVAAAKKAAEEAAAMNAAPEGLIVGNTIQTAAFTTATFSTVPSSAMLAGAMPREEDEEKETHYDASREVRTKGVGFFQFSKDEAERKAEMEELERERLKTAEARQKVGERKQKRKEAVEKKREEVKRRRREKVGDKWLEGFMGGLAESPVTSNSAKQEKEEA